MTGQPGKAVGLDGVSPKMVKSLTERTRTFVLAFVNKCIKEWRMPEDMKRR